MVKCIGEECWDLTEFMVNENIPNKSEDGREWSAQDEKDALMFYLDPKRVKCLVMMERGSYTGEYIALLSFKRPGDSRTFTSGNVTLYVLDNHRYVLWHSNFGTCEYCDPIEGANGFEYIRDTLMENTVQFETVKDVSEYLSKESNDEEYVGYFVKPLANVMRGILESAYLYEGHGRTDLYIRKIDVSEQTHDGW